ncbi:hypothetical protein V7087_16350 [Neobacillus niacini]|uniref:hypothetical protein n=1 Tax=Neobacillus niacini TaxID=86668 RepID=UPI002FFEF098
MIQMNLTNNRIFGLMSPYRYSDFVDLQKQKALKDNLQAKIKNDELVVDICAHS